MDEAGPDLSINLGSDISDDTDSEPEVEQPQSLDLGISREEVELNDSRLGVLLDPSPLPLTLDQLKSLHPGAFTPESMAAVNSVCSELPISFSLSSYQEFAVNAILNRQGASRIIMVDIIFKVQVF